MKSFVSTLLRAALGLTCSAFIMASPASAKSAKPIAKAAPKASTKPVAKTMVKAVAKPAPKAASKVAATASLKTVSKATLKPAAKVKVSVKPLTKTAAAQASAQASLKTPVKTSLKASTSTNSKQITVAKPDRAQLLASAAPIAPIAAPIAMAASAKAASVSPKVSPSNASSTNTSPTNALPANALSANAATPATTALPRGIPKMVNGKIVLMRDDSSRALQMLHQAIEKLLGDKTLTKTDYAAQVVSLRNGRELYAHNATTPLIPASTTKLLPTFGALEQFGTEYLVRTNVYTDATGEIVDGVLRGNVYLVGHGDPLLSVTDLEHLAVQLHNAGIKRITGNVYGDDSFFDRMMSRVEYSGDDDEVQPTGPVSALTVQKNLITIMVSAGPTQGGAVRVQTLPATDAFTFDVKAVVKATKPVRVRRRWVKPTLIISEAGTSKNGKQHFVITGTLNPNTTVSKLFFIQHPAFAAADIFRKRLELFSIKIDGATGLQKTPNAAAMIAEFVRPLTEILKIVNKKSDNFCAEHLFKMLGSPLVSGEKTSVFSETSEQRSAQASVKQLQSILHDHGIPPTLWTINDGSGLSRRNKIAPAMFTRLLDEADRASFRETFLSSLAVAGLDGTLEHRMRGTSAEYNVTAKTGTHKNVSSLAGYVRTKDGERVVFSFMFNGWGVWKYKQVENKLCEVLANFSYSEAAFADSLAVNEQ